MTDKRAKDARDKDKDAGRAKDEPAAEKRTYKKSASQSAKEWIKSIAIALVIWFFLRALLVEAFRIPSGSMEDTLQRLANNSFDNAEFSMKALATALGWLDS